MSKVVFIGACAMTTNFLDNKICTFKVLLSWRFPRKQAFLTTFLSAPKNPPCSERKFYFYCRLAVSDFSGLLIQKGHKHKEVAEPPPPTPPPKAPLTLQILDAWGLFFPSKYRKKAYINNFEGGVLRAPKFFMLNFFACFFCT